MLVAAVAGVWTPGDSSARPDGDSEDVLGLNEAAPLPKLLVLRVRGRIDESALADAERRLGRLAGAPSVDVVVLDIDSPGGELTEIRKLAQRVTDLARGKRTIAYIRAGAAARGLAALLVVAAEEVAMGRGAIVGSSAADAKALDDQTLDEVRGLAVDLAQRRDLSSLIASALVAPALDAVFRVKLRHPPAAGSAYRYLTESDWDTMDRAERVRQYDAAARKVVVSRGASLELVGDDAKEYGIAAHFNLPEEDAAYTSLRAHDPLELQVGPEQLLVDDRAQVIKKSPGVQAVIDFLNLPLVRFLFIVGGLLGLLLELKMFGSMVPGAIGLACFAVFFAAALFPTTGAVAGTCTWFEALLFGLGLALIAVEFLLGAGVVVIGLAGATMCGVTLLLAMVPGSDDGTAGQMSFKQAIVVLGAGVGASGAVSLLALAFLPKSSWFRRSGLVTRSNIEGVPDADSTAQSESTRAGLVGSEGVAESPLRPAGKVLLEGGKLLDVVAQGQFIDRGEPVVVVESTATRIIVARRPNDADAGE